MRDAVKITNIDTGEVIVAKLYTWEEFVALLDQQEVDTAAADMVAEGCPN